MPMIEKMGFDTLCCECGKPKEWEEMGDNDMCADCNEPSPFEYQMMRALYEGEKRAGLLRPQHEIDADLREAGRL